MKKVLLALAIIATAACFTSCNKKCDCKVTVLGVSTTYEDLSVDEVNEKFGTDIKKCSDLNSNVAGIGSVDCTITL